MLYTITKHLATPEKTKVESKRNARWIAVYRSEEVWAVSVHPVLISFSKIAR